MIRSIDQIILWILIFGSIAIQAKICSPDACIKGNSASSLTAHSGSIDLTPGTYPSSAYDLSSLELRNLSLSTRDGTFTVSPPSSPITFGDTNYRESQSSLDEEWESAYLPDGWYGTLAPGSAVWGAVPDKGQLIGLPPMTRRFINVAFDRCDPPCGAGGTCTPSNHSATCQCREGWAGETCDQCASGFWGPNCQACGGDCTHCDDGLAGSGTCLSTRTDSIKGCQCLHGSCGSDGSCTCAAGYLSRSTSDVKCETCATGFFQTKAGDCSACPLGCSNCTLLEGSDSTPSCTACSSTLTLSTSSPVTCVSSQSCQKGQYWNTETSSCSSCSPACESCTGPAPSQCLSCAAPRVNLAGSCVGYTSGTGMCDSSLSGMSGVFIINNEKGECDACPAGCTACTIPSFSPSSSFSSLTCSACQDGYLLESGQCVKTCSDGYFLPSGSADRNGTCQRCDDSCTTCISTATTCTRCPEGLFAYNGQCTPACPYRTSGNNGTCLPCSSTCATCATSLDPAACTACPPDRPVLHANRCLDHCPKAMYFDGTTCQRCDISCSSCMSAADICTSCAEGHVSKKGKCEAVNCAFAQGLGVCLESLREEKSRKWLAFIVLPIVGLAVGLVWWMYIRRQRAKRRAEIKRFGDAIDQVRARSNEDDATLGMRLERILGLNRIRLQNAESRSQTKLKDLLLPTKNARTTENDIPMSDKSEARASTSTNVPPPPPYDLPKRGETRLIPSEKIRSLSSPSPTTSSFPVLPASTSTSTSSSGPKPPPRHKAPADELDTRPTVRFSGISINNRDGLDELWPARKVEGWV